MTIWTFYIKKYDTNHKLRGWNQITHEEAQDLIYSEGHPHSVKFIKSMMLWNKMYQFGEYIMMMEGYPCTDVKDLAA